MATPSPSNPCGCRYSPQAEQGGLTTVGRHGAAINVDFVAGSSGQITIELDGSDSNFPDVNPILNAFTLEREPGDDRPLELHLNTAATTGTFVGADPGEGLDFIGQFTCKTAMLSRFVHAGRLANPQRITVADAVDIAGVGGQVIGDAVFTDDANTAGVAVTAENISECSNGRLGL